jgi:hypothetical protein
VLIDVATPGGLEAVVQTASDDEARKVTQALTNWPFGGADDETVKTVARAQPQAVPNPPAPAREPAPRAATPDAAIPGAADEARRRLIAAQHATLASADALGIPNQRSAAFNPLQPAATPPRNRYLEATRRQQANFGTARLEVEDSSVRANCG